MESLNEGWLCFTRQTPNFRDIPTNMGVTKIFLEAASQYRGAAFKHYPPPERFITFSSRSSLDIGIDETVSDNAYRVSNGYERHASTEEITN